MSIYFITGNENKFKEAVAILPELERLDIDLPEIQSLDPQEVLKAKLQEAFKHHDGQLLVEDVSLYMDCLGGLPGPFIKWFLKTMGIRGLAKIAKDNGNSKARITVLYAFAQSADNVHFFDASVEGDIVDPRGLDTFIGWNPIFQAKGYEKTYAEIKESGTPPDDFRTVALLKLKSFLEQDK